MPLPASEGPGKADDADADVVEAVVEVPVATVGLVAPETAVDIRIAGGPGRWFLIASCPAGSCPSPEWVSRFCHPPVGQAERIGTTIRVEAAQLRALWEDLVVGFGLQAVRATGDGRASLTLRGPRARLRDVLDDGFLSGERTDVVSVAPVDGSSTGGSVELLTGPQRQAVQEALAAGYYDVPRRVTLRDLADRMDISASSLSERLRRAEAELIQTYLGTADAEAPRHNGR